MKTCPKCGAAVGDWREKCEACGRWLVPRSATSIPAEPSRQEVWVDEGEPAKPRKKKRRSEEGTVHRAGSTEPRVVYVTGSQPGIQNINVRTGSGGCASCLTGIGGIVVLLVVIAIGLIAFLSMK